MIPVLIKFDVRPAQPLRSRPSAALQPRRLNRSDVQIAENESIVLLRSHFFLPSALFAESFAPSQTESVRENK